MRGSRRIEVSRKISRHSISERFNSGESYIENRDEKHSNTLSEQRSEIKNVLRKSA